MIVHIRQSVTTYLGSIVLPQNQCAWHRDGTEYFRADGVESRSPARALLLLYQAMLQRLGDGFVLCVNLQFLVDVTHVV